MFEQVLMRRKVIFKGAFFKFYKVQIRKDRSGNLNASKNEKNLKDLKSQSDREEKKEVDRWDKRRKKKYEMKE